jgi:hypothetical protein
VRVISGLDEHLLPFQEGVHTRVVFHFSSESECPSVWLLRGKRSLRLDSTFLADPKQKLNTSQYFGKSRFLEMTGHAVGGVKCDYEYINHLSSCAELC